MSLLPGKYSYLPPSAVSSAIKSVTKYEYVILKYCVKPTDTIIVPDSSSIEMTPRLRKLFFDAYNKNPGVMHVNHIVQGIGLKALELVAIEGRDGLDMNIANNGCVLSYAKINKNQ